MFNKVEYFYMNKLIKTSAVKMDSVVRDVTGGFSYTDNCGDKCLSYTPGGMLNSRLKKRSFWIWLTRNVEGHYLHPVGIQLLLNMQVSSNWIYEIHYLCYYIFILKTV